MPVRENYSRKRVAILDALRGTTVHPTAEWVYEQLKPHYPDLSLGTVYRNIKKFCADDVVKSVGVINGQEHFDADMSTHSHLVCQDCGAVVDIFEVFFDRDRRSDLEDKYRVSIQQEEVIFKGICKNCLDK